jgi:hypothetical protein
MKNKLKKEMQSISMLRQLSFHCLVGQERKEEKILKLIKIMTLNLDKI